ncbi:MAG: GNAT family N-acetyltransferase [Tepidisphaeraceae bacterium]
MHQLVTRSQQPAALPPARVGGAGMSVGDAGVRIRPGTPADLAFIDALQKKHGKQLGFMNRATLEGKITLGHVLIAEEGTEGGGVRREEILASAASLKPHASSPSPSLLGYLIGNDRYRHRDELGVIFQMCVAPEFRRSLVAAHLLKAQFERSAYGCKLYCCWCAQDIEANRFWESMGFVPIAFRAGSEKRNRVHIFWQRRIRDGDTETPWWFPSETTGGMMDASRIALPIPAGMHWQDELPRLIPTEAPTDTAMDAAADEGAATLAKPIASTKRKKPAAKVIAPPEPVIIGIRSGGLRLTPDVFEPAAAPARPEPVVKAKPQKPKRVKKASPELAARARELRDRWMEAAGRGEGVALPAPKYHIGRASPGQNSLADAAALNDYKSLSASPQRLLPDDGEMSRQRWLPAA